MGTIRVGSGSKGSSVMQKNRARVTRSPSRKRSGGCGCGRK